MTRDDKDADERNSFASVQETFTFPFLCLSYIFTRSRISIYGKHAGFQREIAVRIHHVVSLIPTERRKRQLTDTIDTTMKINDCLAK
jgi:hypothetical protein